MEDNPDQEAIQFIRTDLQDSIEDGVKTYRSLMESLLKPLHPFKDSQIRNYHTKTIKVITDAFNAIYENLQDPPINESFRDELNLAKKRLETLINAQLNEIYLRKHEIQIECIVKKVKRFTSQAEILYDERAEDFTPSDETTRHDVKKNHEMWKRDAFTLFNNLLEEECKSMVNEGFWCRELTQKLNDRLEDLCEEYPEDNFIIIEKEGEEQVQTVARAEEEDVKNQTELQALVKAEVAVDKTIEVSAIARAEEEAENEIKLQIVSRAKEVVKEEAKLQAVAKAHKEEVETTLQAFARAEKVVEEEREVQAELVAKADETENEIKLQTVASAKEKIEEETEVEAVVGAEEAKENPKAKEEKDTKITALAAGENEIDKPEANEIEKDEVKNEGVSITNLIPPFKVHHEESSKSEKNQSYFPRIIANPISSFLNLLPASISFFNYSQSENATKQLIKDSDKSQNIQHDLLILQKQEDQEENRNQFQNTNNIAAITLQLKSKIPNLYPLNSDSKAEISSNVGLAEDLEYNSQSKTSSLIQTNDANSAHVLTTSRGISNTKLSPSKEIQNTTHRKYNFSTTVKENPIKINSRNGHILRSNSKYVQSARVENVSSGQLNQKNKAQTLNEKIKETDFVSLVPPKNVCVGIYIDKSSFKIGLYEINEMNSESESYSFQEVLSISPQLFFEDDKIIIGDEARPHRLHKKGYCNVYELITQDVSLNDLFIKYESYKLCSHEIIALFLQQILSSAEIKYNFKIQKIIFTFPFTATSAVKERIQKSARIAGFNDIRILSTVLTSGVAHLNIIKYYKNASYLNLWTSSKSVFVVDYQEESFSMGIVKISPIGIVVKNPFGSVNIPECQEDNFLRMHKSMYNGENIPLPWQTYIANIYKTAVNRVWITQLWSSMDCIAVSENEKTSEYIQRILRDILDEKLNVLNLSHGSLLGASMLASLLSVNYFQSVGVQDSMRSNLQYVNGFYQQGTTRFTTMGNNFHNGHVFRNEFDIKFPRRDDQVSFYIQLNELYGVKQNIFEACRYQIICKCTASCESEMMNVTFLSESIQTKIRIHCLMDADGVYTLRAQPIPDSPARLDVVRMDDKKCDSACKSEASSFKRLLEYYNKF